ncbi:branched-chain amino acid ABC transporter, periplasmic branched-chain amino acid binding protein [Oceanicola granulosus HTCC2516]|uniref:Branched-chain amino acid ABC transporter, periplasmic branched-chain amino acid binding protein n=1 Tax=Oceanicola granulosus (strain ATCC BAA-861 / DSM 15982 / KCTC 12143 / HTCC2516) TaxID=314256 RepID=Q2CEU3_OCEGH|nr:ABC transporter substrate-binding protein [Oceanicola granulosus]EAR51165.1 branched-chain amino acid ABC transporter, periplasmic branched-chain amino acid binding protein [Oceanicola granulosus HTCC2516]
MTNRNLMTALAGTAATIALAAPALAQEETVKIGLAVPLTGDYAIYNEVAGAQCMAEMINAEGGVDGMPIELLIQDSGSDTQAAITSAERFMGEGVVSIGTIPFSDTMIPLAQIVGQNGISVIQAQSTQVEMHAGIVDNFISNVAPDPYTAAAAANHALEQGVQNVAIFTSDDGGSWSAKVPEWFAEVITENGGTLQTTLNYSAGTSDFSPQIAELRALDPAPDAVYISWAMPEIGILIRQMRAAGLDAWVIGSDGFDDPSLDALADEDPALLDKVFFGTLAPSQPGSRIDEFQQACAEIGHEVNGLFPALGADMVRIVAHGVEAAGSTDPAAVREAIRSAESIPVMSVEDVSFAETTSYALREIPVIGFENGERVLLSLEVPENVPAWN